MLDGVTNREEDAQREVQRQRNLEQALLIQMEMQKKLHEQLEVSLFPLCNHDCKDNALLYCTVMLAMCLSHIFIKQLQSDLLFLLHAYLDLSGTTFAPQAVLFIGLCLRLYVWVPIERQVSDGWMHEQTSGQAQVNECMKEQTNKQRK